MKPQQESDAQQSIALGSGFMQIVSFGFTEYFTNLEPLNAVRQIVSAIIKLNYQGTTNFAVNWTAP